LLQYTDSQQLVAVSDKDLSDVWIMSMSEDRQGNLWITTRGFGVFKSSGDFIVRYTKADGLPDQNTECLVEGDNGPIYVSTRNGGIGQVVGERVTPVAVSQTPEFRGVVQEILHDSRGNYWIVTADALYRVAGPALDLRRREKLGAVNGAPAAHRPFGVGLYEDPSGKLWCGAFGDRALYVFDPKDSERPVFRRMVLDASLGVPPEKNPDVLHCVVSDRSGALWFGWQFDLGRYRDGKLTLIEPIYGRPATPVRSLFVDSRGWLWVGLQDGGVLMTTDPAAELPEFTNISSRNGLATSLVSSITEDGFGRVYFSTGKGLDRLDPSTGHIRHFTVADGMAGSTDGQCLRDREGNIWVTGSAGLSRLNPRAERAEGLPPPAYFIRVQVAGEDIALPETGTTRLPKISLPASRNNLLIEYVGISFQGEGELRYQYKLDGVDKDWSVPTEQRSINYANLSPGSYKVFVRTVNSEGQPNESPSLLEFRILRPIWQQWWVLSLFGASVLAAAFALHRMRIRRITAMEKIRRQVATDLHDDVGSGLAQIAILTEVAKRNSSSSADGLLTEVADLARSMRESMSDIVWSVDPRKDSVAELVQRMRQAGFNLLEVAGVRVDFQAPEESELAGIGLAPDRRRHLLLIFKESITNVARHSQADSVSVVISLRAGELRFAIKDNGRGFDPDDNHKGHGLHSLQVRADEMGAKLGIESSPGHGTVIRLTVPVGRG